MRIRLTDARSSRTVSGDELPIPFGGPDPDAFCLSDHAEAPLIGHLGINRNHPFFQPADTRFQVRNNREPIKDSCWLKDGDLLQLADDAIRCRKESDEFHLELVQERKPEPAQDDEATSLVETRSEERAGQPLYVSVVRSGTVEKQRKLDLSQTFKLGLGRDAENDIPTPTGHLADRQLELSGEGHGWLQVRCLLADRTSQLNQHPMDSAAYRVESGDQISFRSSPEIRVIFSEDSDLNRQTEQPEKNIQLPESGIEEQLKNRDDVVIGRSTRGADYVIQHPMVSGRHAVIRKVGPDQYTIQDLQSLNGTYVNGKRLSNRPTPIQVNDQIFVGSFLIPFRGKAKDLRDEAAIQTLGLEKKYPNGYTGLHPVNLEIPAKSLLAIMGPSGCGKSTLLKCLNGDSPATSGRVFIHGLDLVDHYEYLKHRIGYVPQDDIVHRELTVEKSLYFAAKLRLDRPRKAVVKQKIDKVLKELHIEHIRKQRISRISGGQRKRVCIAVELLTDPLILFLDEPT
ncbi:MAG: ATP-binding cassette domain-containing protein, partial [Verrucomicrobiota bacterium]